MKDSSWRTHVCSTLYALTVPLSFLAGIEFSDGKMSVFYVLLVVVMAMEYMAGVVWMSAYKAEMAEARKTEAHK